MNRATRSYKHKTITTRSKRDEYTRFIQLPLFNRHKKKRAQQKENIPLETSSVITYWNDNDDDDVSVASEYSIMPVLREADLDEDDVSVASEYSIIPVLREPDLDKDEYVVDIDFDEAHDAWLENKKRLADGKYVYLCGKITNGGKSKCRRGCYDKIGLYSGCKIHYMWEEIEHHA